MWKEKSFAYTAKKVKWWELEKILKKQRSSARPIAAAAAAAKSLQSCPTL